MADLPDPSSRTLHEATACPGTPGRSHCVLLLRPHSDRPTALLTGLEKRDVAVAIATDAAGVMERLALACCNLVVIVDPGHVPQLVELREAVRRYYPGVAMWRYDAALNGNGAGLSRFVERGAAADSSASSAAADVGNAEARLEKTAEAKPRVPEEAALLDTSSDGALLTAEELALLIGGDPRAGESFDGDDYDADGRAGLEEGSEFRAW